MEKEEIQNHIERAIQGDENAYEALLKRYERGIYNMIYQMVKNREETEDLVQETFIKAFNALESYNNQFAFSTWLYKIAFNNCIDSIRKRKLKTYPLDKPIQTKEGQVQQEIRDDSSSPEKEMLFAEKRKQVNEAIGCLPAKYKKVIILRHQEERSYEEISEIMKIPLGTVKARIFRAREMLKRCLQEE
ncbi:sigma-70 family RNA polymerase sigma factor [bacterium]